jgi:hypothetical protein
MREKKTERKERTSTKVDEAALEARQTVLMPVVGSVETTWSKFKFRTWWMAFQYRSDRRSVKHDRRPFVECCTG